MQYLLIDAELVKSLVQYLSRRPWIEVHQVMEPLMGLKPAEPQKTDAELMAEHHGRYG